MQLQLGLTIVISRIFFSNTEIDDTTRNCTKMHKDAEELRSIIYLHFPASLL